MRVRAALLAVALVLSAAPVMAQRSEGAPTSRVQLERRVREAMWAQTQRRVGLTDEQMRKLAEVAQRIEPRRAALLRDARLARQALRRAMDAEPADQERVGEQLALVLRTQRGQLELVEQEQRDLAAFMTPVQRARYFALQEQFRQRLEEIRRRRAGPGAPPVGGPPPGRRAPPNRPR